jgi:hypothetical protein
MMITLLKSGRFAKREVQAISAHERVVAFFERHDAMIVKSRRSAPNHHIAVGYWYATRFVSSLRSPKQKDGWDANPRSTTAPGLNSSFQDMSPLALAKRFMLIASSLQRVVENDPDRIAVPGADTADPVSQIDPIDTMCPLHRTVMNGESDRVALP